MENRKSGIVRLRNNNLIKTVDYYLIIPVLLLTVIGLYVQQKVLSVGYAAYPGNYYRQIIATSIGIVIVLLISLIDTHFM